MEFLTGSSDFKKRKVRIGFREDIEPHEILLDKLAKRKEEELGLSEQKLETPLLKIILEGLFFFSLFLFFLLFAKTFQLQVVEGKNLSALAEGNKFIIHQIKAERGVIYDRNGRQLVFNRPSFDLIFLKNNFPQEEFEQKRILKEISQILKINPGDLEKKIEEAKTPEVLIAENLEHQTLIILETKIGELPGFQIKNNTVRDYPGGSNFAHLVGYQRKINEKTGLEESYDGVLREKPGELLTERDVQGNTISKKIISLPESGKSLVLWLDSDLQEKIIQALESSLKRVGAESGSVVALDPKTGGVLALVSLPSFDNNLFSKGMSENEWKTLIQDPLHPLFNRAIAGTYLTGSTIKPLVASAALEEKIISPEKKINCQGKITIPNPWDPSLTTIKKDWTTHGWTDLRKAIAESCNVFFYTIGGGYKDQAGLGPTRIKKYLELFGWDEKTGIDLPGEAAGFLPDKEWKKTVLGEDWWDGDTYNLSIGQGFLQVTPLEVVNAFSVIANGGTLYQPQVVKEIVDTSTGSQKIVEEFGPKIIRQNSIDPNNLQIVREGMRQAVTGENSPQASAGLLNSLPVTVAAKTGTAELGNNRYHNWVTVFAPYENPQIVLTVMIEDVKGDQVAALPVAKEVLNWYFAK